VPRTHKPDFLISPNHLWTPRVAARVFLWVSPLCSSRNESSEQGKTIPPSLLKWKIRESSSREMIFLTATATYSVFNITEREKKYDEESCGRNVRNFEREKKRDLSPEGVRLLNGMNARQSKLDVIGKRTENRRCSNCVSFPCASTRKNKI
jgi:hypothetical protein